MGRKRVNELEAGGKTTLYIPQDVDPEVLEYLRSQRNLSKALIGLVYDKVYNRTRGIDLDIKEYVAELVNKEFKKAGEKVGMAKSAGRSSDKKSEAIRNMRF